MKAKATSVAIGSTASTSQTIITLLLHSWLLQINIVKASILWAPSIYVCTSTFLPLLHQWKIKQCCVRYALECSHGQHSFNQWKNHNSTIIFMIATNKHCQSIYIMSAIYLCLYIYLVVIAARMKNITMIFHFIICYIDCYCPPHHHI